MVEFNVPVPGNLTLIDHAIFRTDKGAVGFLKARGGCSAGLIAAGAWQRRFTGWMLGFKAVNENSGLLVAHPLPQVRPQGNDKRRDICECRSAVGGLRVGGMIAYQRKGCCLGACCYSPTSRQSTPLPIQLQQ